MIKNQKHNPVENVEGFIKNRIKEFVRTNPRNRLLYIDESPIFDEPLVAYTDGHDPLFLKYKEIIGNFHLTPEEIFAKEVSEEKEELSVICWILPITEKTRASNRDQKEYPSKRWSHTRQYGEELNDALRDYVVSLLEDLGYIGVAPVLTDLFEVKEKTPAGIASSWSERHIQYVAGQGTFGLSDGLITAAGKAMRCGSVVTNLKLRPSQRKYKTRAEYCLFFSNHLCQECIKRCPVGAISESGHDKEKCREYNKYIFEKFHPIYKVEPTGCGLCQTDVPCERNIPRAKDGQQENPRNH